MSLRTGAALGIAMTLAALAMPISASAEAPLDPAAVALPPAAETVAACAKHSRHLLVDIAVDRSASLHNSDPADRRVDGIRAALTGLAGGIKSGDGVAPRVEVLMSSFAGDVAPKRPGRAWRILDSDTLDGLRAKANLYRSRDTGRDTDYVLAFGAARRALDARAAEIAARGEGRSCKALIFLSDGRFELGNRTGSDALPSEVFYASGVDLDTPHGGEQAVEAGHRFLCRAGGLMDQIAAGGIVKFTIALSSAGSLGQADLERLGALTTGHAGEERCGSALSERTGEFTEVRDSRDLAYVLAHLLDPEVCLPGQCPNPNQLITAPGLSGFMLSASAPAPGVVLSLRDPSGKTTRFSSEGVTQVEVAGASIRAHSLSIEARFHPDSRAWLGRWRFLFFVPGEVAAPVPTYSLRLQSELRPALAGKQSLVTGGTSTVELDLVDRSGAPVTGGVLVRSAQMQGRAVDGSGASRPVDIRAGENGLFEAPVKVPDDAPGGDWRLEVEASFTAGGVPVEPAFVSLSLPQPQHPHEPPRLLEILVLLAVASLLFLGWRRAAAVRFTPPRHLRVFARDALVQAGASVELDPDPGRAAYGDFWPLRRTGGSARAARVQQPPFLLRVPLFWRLRGRRQGRAVAGRHQLIGGGVDGSLPGNEDLTSCLVPLALAGTWLFAVESIDELGAVRGKLVVFTAEEAPPTLGPEALVAARAALLAQDWEGFDRGGGEAGDGDGRDPLEDVDNEIGWGSV